tara:strand:+ start:881 stop:1801 length:921 start_codon:yes stop_codon:yes gene_type:complete
MSNKKVRKKNIKFHCSYCDYNTERKSQYERHLATLKHQKLADTTNQQQNTTEKVHFVCNCGKIYNHRASLYNHKKKCFYNDELKLEPNYRELIMKLINENHELRNTVLLENKELRNQINEMIPKIGNNNINQKFNINVFLNDECKDAITMEQFIEKIEITMSNLLLTKNKGINEGISNIFIENMNKLSLYERPIHCTDTKRETVYIKSDGDNGDNPKWEKDIENEKLKKAIKNVAHVQEKNINKWIEEHPNWQGNPELQNEYVMLVKNCTDNLEENNRENKVIKKIIKDGGIGVGGDPFNPKALHQ